MKKITRRYNRKGISLKITRTDKNGDRVVRINNRVVRINK